MTSRSLGRPEAEAALLGALFLDPPRIRDVRAIVTIDDFTVVRHRLLAQAQFELDATGSPVDPQSVVTWLRSSEDAQRCRPREGGWLGWVVDLARAVTSTAHVTHHARAVAESALLRQL